MSYHKCRGPMETGKIALCSAFIFLVLFAKDEMRTKIKFGEILRERDVQAQWFDVRKVMRTNDRFGRAEPDVAALAPPMEPPMSVSSNQ